MKYGFLAGSEEAIMHDLRQQKAVLAGSEEAIAREERARTKAVYLDGCRDEEDLLLEPQLTTVLGGIVGVQHSADVLSTTLLLGSLHQQSAG